MGYTHYFEQQRNFTNAEWIQIQAFARNLFKELPGVLGDLMGGDGEPEATLKWVAFNGIGEEAHETFAITKEGSGYDFCKTAEKEYDIAVVAMLCYINHVAADALIITSNGLVSEWEAGRELGSKVAGVDLKVPGFIKISYQ